MKGCCLEGNCIGCIGRNRGCGGSCGGGEGYWSIQAIDLVGGEYVMKELSEMSIEELWELFPIFLTDHKEEWEVWYEEESSAIKKVLSDVKITRISHIGSTAINGIWAKPIVDILVEIPEECDMDEIKSILVVNGYCCMAEDKKHKSFNKGYTKYGFAERVFHLHLRMEGDNDELYFRDFMNDNPELAEQYEKLKLSLWKKFEHDRDGYTGAKSEFVRENTQRAKLEYGNRYYPG